MTLKHQIRTQLGTDCLLFWSIQWKHCCQGGGDSWHKGENEATDKVRKQVKREQITLKESPL